jgi:phosphoesterase RecJ-like protein
VELLAVPEGRASRIRELSTLLKPGMTVALSTHINADGDGCGSETAMSRLLAQRGITTRIVNPTPWPAMYDFLLDGSIDQASVRGAEALENIDMLLVLDINDIRRLGVLSERVRALQVPVAIIDHHVTGDEPVATSVIISDVDACATGELVFDFASVLGLEVTPQIAQSLYCALLTDTGSFRFSNTSPRCHAIAARLLALGVDPEEMYRRIYAQVTVGKLLLVREALESLQVEDDVGLAWISVEAGAMERYAVTSDDLEGIVEHPRSIVGNRIALFFRDLGHNRVKVSFRGTGDVDVQQLARGFGGGGHAKASGALIAGSLDDVRARVVGAAREYLNERPAT